jgi:hypothetical protein
MVVALKPGKRSIRMTSPPMGGAGEIVEVDETVFGKQDGVTMVTLLPIQ